MPDKPAIIQVVLPVPIGQYFDYLPPSDTQLEDIAIGARVRVPFGRRQLVGVVIGTSPKAQVAFNKLKNIIRVIDSVPLLQPAALALLRWTSQYYHHPLGEVVLSSLPKVLREGLDVQLVTRYELTALGKQTDLQTLARTPKQRALLGFLQAQNGSVSKSELQKQASFAVINALVQKKLLASTECTTSSLDLNQPEPCQLLEDFIKPADIQLNEAQQDAVKAITAVSEFKTYLLDGVTGSGKTEVYLQVIAKVLQQGKQALLLVPEIALTPQTVSRFRNRFNVPIAVLHSGLNATEKYQAWCKAWQNKAKIIIGTRSAIFVPLPVMGVIILDEEHDSSFKQQSGCRYSARDLAVVRGRHEKIPVILGSATPSLESLHNCYQQRYHHLRLPKRAGLAVKPSFHLIDLRRERMTHGLSSQLCHAIERHLKAQGQVLLFLNRRGFAPVLLCHHCGWSAKCSHCDAKFILHQKAQQLRCHHCGQTQGIPQNCAACGSTALMSLGMGTERIEQALTKRFTEANCVRIDRDTTRRKGSLEAKLASIKDNQAQILIGTQMLAKGHHFPNVTMVGIIDVDSGLYSSDFRAVEHLAQTIIQVAGRAGRAQRPGEVYLQTHEPDNPLLHVLMRDGFNAFAQSALTERENALLPPFAHMALIRAQSLKLNNADQFLRQVQHQALQSQNSGVEIFDPVPAPMARKAGFHRAQLLLQATNRQALQKLLATLCPRLKQLDNAKKVRFSIDVDPLEMS